MMENTTAVHNKTALITGGARGIGKAIVLELASKGYNVIINYNSSEKEAMELKDTLEKQCAFCLVYKADIRNEQEFRNMIDEAISKFGKIDVLINNSAVTHDSLFRDKTIEDFKDTLNVNVVGTFLVSKLVGEIMYENKFGRIINMTSTNGINTYFPMCIDYDASKSAIISLTHNLATQFAPYVCVNAIAPGFIATESEIGDMDEEFIRAEEEKVMVRRAGTPEEVAKLVSFLVSDDAGFINNTVIRIDGGIYGSC